MASSTNLFMRDQEINDSNKPVEDSLTRMQIDFKRITEELDRLPEHGKKIAIINKRRELERQQEDLRKRIAQSKNMLRNRNMLHQR